MKKEVSSLELRFLVQELQLLVGCRIDKIYQPAPKTFVLALRKAGEDKRFLRIELPKFLYLTSRKEEMPGKLTGFCGYLRKYLEGLAITGVEQLSSERVVKFSLASKEESFSVFLEFFAKGNMIICDGEGTIVNCLEPVVFKERIVKPGVAYELPERANAFTLTFDQFKQLQGENISTAIATGLGMGGLVAHELCALAGVAPAAKITPDAVEKLFVAWQTLLKRKAVPLLVLKDEIPDEVLPFAMKQFEKTTTTPLHSLSEGLDKLFVAPVAAKKETRADKVKTIIAMQEQSANKFEAVAAEEQKRGEFMYEHYQDVKQILDELVLQMKHHSLQELQVTFKGHKHVKEIDPKTGNVTVEF